MLRWLAASLRHVRVFLSDVALSVQARSRELYNETSTATVVIPSDGIGHRLDAGRIPRLMHDPRVIISRCHNCL